MQIDAPTIRLVIDFDAGQSVSFDFHSKNVVDCGKAVVESAYDQAKAAARYYSEKGIWITVDGEECFYPPKPFGRIRIFDPSQL